jgi:peroxiredoxin
MKELGENLIPFNLKDQDNNDFKSENVKGKRLLLSFHPLAWTQVCVNQMRSMEDNLHVFDELNTIPVGISVDHVYCNKAWAKELGIKNVKLLADFWPHGAVAKSLGAFRENEGISQRANFIVDEEGKIVFSKLYDIPELPDINEIIDFLKK